MWFHRFVPTLACGFALLLPSLSLAQDRLRVGQDVEIQVRGQWVEAEVLRVMPGGGAVQVKIRENGRTQAGVVPLSRVRVSEKDRDSGAAPPAGEMRTWSDSTGQFKIEAALVAKEGANIKLRKKDGGEVTVPISRLSRADVEYLATAPDAAPTGSGFQVNERVEVLSTNRWYPAVVLKVDGQRWFIHYDGFGDNWDEWVEPDRIRKPGSAAPAGRLAAGAPATPAGASSTPGATAPRMIALNIESVQCNVKSATAGTIEKTAPPKNLAADPAKHAPPPIGAAVLRELGTFESLTGMTPAGETTMLASIINEPPGKPATTHFAWCDLQRGGVTKTIAVGGGHNIVASDPAAGWLLTANPDDAGRMLVWKWPQPDEDPQGVYTLMISSDDPSPFSKKIESALFGEQGRAVLVTGGDQVVVWSLEGRQAERVWSASEAAVSPGGRYLAIYGNDGMAVFEVASGKQLGYWPLGYVAVADIAFSPEGRQLAFTYGDRHVRVFDLATGETRYQGILSQGAVFGDDALIWTSENHLLIGRQYLLDLGAGFVVWQYDPQSPGKGGVMRGVNGRVAYFAQEWRGPRAPSLAVVTLPHEGVAKAIAAFDKSQLFGVAPGMEASLHVNVVEGDAAKIRAALERQATANGWKINPASPVKVVASLTRGEQKTQTYSRGLGFGGTSTTVSYRPFVHTVEVVIDGETCWSQYTESGPPGLLMAKEGQTLQQTASQYEKPNLEFFEKLGLPRQLVRPKFLNGLGQSELSVRGVAAP